MSALNNLKYISNGLANNDCANVIEWLEQLAEDYDMSFAEVYTLALSVGPNELFDGLVSEVKLLSDTI